MLVVAFVAFVGTQLRYSCNAAGLALPVMRGQYESWRILSTALVKATP
jgi:hypothetical protein